MQIVVTQGRPEKRVQAVYVDLSRQIGQMARDSNSGIDRDQLLKTEREQLRKVVALLTPEQRRALLASQRGPPTDA
jgi:hypothetical protein